MSAGCRTTKRRCRIAGPLIALILAVLLLNAASGIACFDGVTVKAKSLFFHGMVEHASASAVEAPAPHLAPYYVARESCLDVLSGPSFLGMSAKPIPALPVATVHASPASFLRMSRLPASFPALTAPPFVTLRTVIILT